MGDCRQRLSHRTDERWFSHQLHFTAPRSERTLPDPCADCVEFSGLSISIRDVFDEEKIRFRVDDPQDSLPSPFPVFGSWTRFEEDIYYD